jgi:hypothetical protein
LMPPPTDGPKKRGTKRSAAVALGPDGLPIPKVRGKPGPKKKARLYVSSILLISLFYTSIIPRYNSTSSTVHNPQLLPVLTIYFSEDGTIDHSASTPRAPNGTAAHKLGPKANQGAINAGLRALDRSGKPCRKWQKGGFTLKSFTGVVWEIPRWKAPPRFKAEGGPDDSISGDSSKENKDSQVESEKSNTAMDVVMASSPAQSAPSAQAEPTPPEPIASDSNPRQPSDETTESLESIEAIPSVSLAPTVPEVLASA